MKKVLRSGIIALIAMTALSTTGYAAENGTQTTINLPGNQWRVGLDTIFAGRLKRDENGAPKYLYGITLGLGVGFRYYFTVNDELQAAHPYLEGGTTTIIYPYFGGGIEYDLPNGDDPAGERGAFSVGGGIYFFSKIFGADFIPFPVITVSYSFK